MKPLIHCITNYVTMDWVARGLLAAGARPVMARDVSEAAAMASGADALLLNLGTWSPELQEAMLAAGRAANAKGIPVVLDPVGAGGLPTRTKAALELLEAVQVTAIRGNAGEIAALAGAPGLTRGVDAVVSVPAQTPASAPAQAPASVPAQAAATVARRHGCLVAVTGPVDLVTDGTESLEVRSGHPLLAQIPGAGCLASALVAAALTGDRSLRTVTEALLRLGTAGEAAAAHAHGPGTFAIALLDALASPDPLPDGRIAPPLADRLAVYVIVSGTTPLATLEQVLQTGVGAIQFREKHLPLGAQVAVARAMRDLCHRHGALFLVNDRADLALAVQADGVHLGQDDLPVAEARRLLGPSAIIGGTCETAEEARIAEAQGADYIGTGPVYATPSKADAGAPYGPAIAERISAATRLPVVGIGGIGPGGAAPVIRAGACGVSVISSVVGAQDPGAAARVLLSEVKGAKRK